ncbi:MAG: fumarylacetoacetate hydrolase family protein, partial [Burkholderiales bacterium]|nr:fumarylacetoacetate hydrolase family protein [Burkholderiales bacterium]
MKLVTFDLPSGERRIGALLPGETRIADFSATGAPWSRDMIALIDAGAPALAEARALLAAPRTVHELAAVRLAAPVPEPRQMRDFLCFEKHLRQARTQRHLFGITGYPTDPAKVDVPRIWYEEPVYYKCNRFAVVGTGTDVVCPAYCKMLDYELEFGIFLGKRGKNIRREDAASHIFGYCIFNDFSARDQQMREMQAQLGPTKGKDFDTANVMGPWLVTADEVPDPYALTMVARVNGEEWSRGSSGEMHHKFADILAHVSKDETVYPGEFFGSGTVG